MTAFGLDPSTIQAIRSVLQRYPSIREAKVFGSRALGTFRPNSDIDLALFGSIDLDTTLRIQRELDELSTPYQFDVVSYDLIEHAALKEHIERVGQVIYS